jgi:ceramide glucosyltransferase
MRPIGYAGLLLTQGVAASALLLAIAPRDPRAWVVAAAALGFRLAMAWFVGVRCLRDVVARESLWLVPLRDLLSFGLWIAAFFGDSIVWRGKRFALSPGGRLRAEASATEGAADAALAQSGIAS